MKIHVCVKRTLSTGEIVVSEEHDLRLGTYNEFYLPALLGRKEMWITVTDDSGVETKFHLKR